MLIHFPIFRNRDENVSLANKRNIFIFHQIMLVRKECLPLEVQMMLNSDFMLLTNEVLHTKGDYPLQLIFIAIVQIP